MPSEKTLEALRTAEPAWDELREQRVLGRVFEAHHVQVARRRLVRAVGAAAVAAGAILAVTVLWPNEPASRIVATAPHAPAPAGSSLALSDGSEAVLAPGASVEIREQSEDRVVLDQAAGDVHYDVRPNRSRSFVVRLGDVHVVVVGTRFRLAWAGEWVRVKVERGRVRVDDGTREVELVAGEEIRVLANRDDSAAPSAAPAAAEEETVPEPRMPVVRSEPVVPSVASLLSKADTARAEGRLGEAATALGQIATLHANDPRVSSALFTLGRVERARGRPGAAATAYERCWRRAPRGPLAEDAEAEAAAAWAAAGDRPRAKAAAQRYLDTYPHGTHAGRMRPIAE